MSSHKRKRRNSHNAELPTAKRRKSDDNKDSNKNKAFPFESAKACDKIVPLNQGKKAILRLKIREQSIRLKQKSDEIKHLQSRIKNGHKNYGHYHRLLITFTNTFDQIFATLQQKISANDSTPLC